ncbi:MAG: hypothetical protein H7Y38_20665 [Armatimonadetes bacterium]|nr:hypothetical protein [Armatimonadota bacterium]
MRENKDNRQDKRTVEARHLLHLPDITGDRHIITVDAAPAYDGGIVILSTENAPDYRTQDNMFAKAQGDKPNRFRVDYWTPNALQTIGIAETPNNYHSAQPLNGGEWLLTCHRARGSESNGVVYGERGELVRSFFLGDGIESVQTTPSGKAIWVSYFDEGVYSGGTLEHNGLVCFDREGTPTLRFSELPHGDLTVPVIDDCYALNVASDTETFAYYYTDFPLVRIANGAVTSVRDDLKIAGSKGFAVFNNRALFGGGYGETDRVYLLNLRSEKIHKKIAHPVTESGDALTITGAFARGRFFYLRSGDDLHVLELDYDL